MSNFISAKTAAEKLADGMNIGICGFGGWLGADLVFSAIRDRYSLTGHPAGLRVISGILPGNLTDEPVGMNLLALDGLLSQISAAHVGMAPLLGRMIAENRIRAFALPLGLVSNTLRAAAGRKPLVLSRVGLGTFCDPRLEGGALNAAAADSREAIAQVLTIDGEEFLAYKAPKLDACILRASLADKSGNVSSMNDPMTAEQLEMALAAKACGGVVIVQADRLVPADTIPAKEILLHNSLVDYIVVDVQQACPPGYDCPSFRPELCGYMRAPLSALKPMSLNQRKLCGRRAALELKPGNVINLGIGMPDSVAAVAAEEGLSSQLLLSVESGPLGGVPVGGVGFGAAVNPEVIYTLGDTFDFYDGGGLDIAFLGAGEIDEAGNVNVSKFGPKTTGPGGFINITQNTPFVCFMCTFTAAGLKTAVENGKLAIRQEGSVRKFRKRVQQVSFSADFAKKNGQKILYITERAVFSLGQNGLVLTEIAPGIQLENDILANMDFVPEISPHLKEMDPRIFLPSPMGLT